jgi:hypothetical protein
VSLANLRPYKPTQLTGSIHSDWMYSTSHGIFTLPFLMRTLALFITTVSFLSNLSFSGLQQDMTAALWAGSSHPDCQELLKSSGGGSGSLDCVCPNATDLKSA